MRRAADDYRRELERLIAVRGVAGRVRVVGHCEDVPAALSLAAVAVIASTEPEAFGRTAVEAAGDGRARRRDRTRRDGRDVLSPPAVAARRRTGWLVPPGDAAALAAAIGEALADATGRAVCAARMRAPACPELLD